MMTPETLLIQTMAEWEEWLEMYPERYQWFMLSHILATKLLKEREDKEYYKKVADAYVRTKHS